MKFSIKGFFSKCDQIRSFLRIWLHLLKKSLMENFIFCAVCKVIQDHLNQNNLKNYYLPGNFLSRQDMVGLSCHEQNHLNSFMTEDPII